MQLRQLEHFEALHRLRSFTLAATEQHLTQPALSRSIATLEASLGQQLFDRSTHHVEVTPAGQALHPYVIDTLASARSIREMASSMDGRVKGLVRIGTGAYPAFPLLSNVMQHASSEYGDLRFSVSSGPSNSLLASLVARDLDFVVCDTSKRETSPYSGDLDVIAIAGEPLAFVASSRHPITGSRPTDAAISGVPWALPTVAPLGRRRMLRAFPALRAEDFPHYELESTTACLDMVQDQRTITLVPLSVARAGCGARGLSYWCTSQSQRTNDGIHLLRSRTLSTAAAKVIELVEQEGRRLADAGTLVAADRDPSGWFTPGR